MPIYEIAGKIVESAAPLSDADIDEIYNSIKGRSGIIESAVGSAKRGYEASKTAVLAPFIGGEEAAQRGIAAQEGIQERPGFNWQAIKNKYEQEGLLPAAGEAASQIPGTVAEQAPTLGAIFTGGRLGAMGGGELGGMIGGAPGAAIGATIGGIGGAALYPFLSQSGENIQRQYQEQVARGETPDVSLGKAYGAGLGQTALEMALGPEARLLRGAGKDLTEESLKALAKQGTVEGLLRGTGRAIAEEIPTEIAQQALTRLQAGLPISPTDQQALDEYLASGVGAALAGPVGGPMRLMESGSARGALTEQERVRKEKENARFQNIAQNIYSDQGVTLQDIINQNIGIQEALSEKDKKKQDAQYIKDVTKWFDEDSGERSTLPDGTEKLLSNYEAYLKQYPVDAELSKKELAEKVVDANKQIESIQEQGQQQIPGLEQGPATSLFKPSEVSKEDPIASAVDYLRSLPKTFTNPSQVKEALESEGSAFKDLNLGPKKVLDLYKTAPVQQQLFDEEGALSPDVIKGYENQQKINQAMADKLTAAKPNETLDIFGRARVAPQTQEEVAPEIPSQGGSANLLMQQAMKEAEQQTAIDQANRARQTLYGLPETAPMGYASAEQRAQSIQESAPYQQRALDIQQRLQEEELKAQQKKASEAMGKKLEQAKPGETLDIFGNARVAPQTQEEVTSEVPSQGGSANLQIQQAIREAELNNDIEKANRLRQQLYATPEGELLSSTQQQQRVEAEPFKLAAEKKTADLKAAREEGRLPTDAVTPETLTTLSPELGKTAIAKRIASSPANYSMNNAEGLNDIVKSLQAISTKKPELAPSVNPFLANLKKHVETLSPKATAGKKFSKSVEEIPHVDNNLGQPIHPTKEGLKNFWNWFGGSKVKDENGRPKVVYHGTDADFNEFDLKADRVNRGNNPEGVYLTPDKHEAGDYGKNVMPLYAKAENTYIEGTSKVNQKMAEKYGEILKNNYPGYGDDWVDSVLVPDFIRTGRFKDIAGHFKTEVMKAGGYDSWQDGRHIIVFDPGQIKSATGNQGTFNPEEADIKKSAAAAPVKNPHTAKSLQEALTKRYGNNAPKITIGSLTDVDNDTSVQGYYHPDTGVTLIPENIDQSKDLHGLIRHEVAVHAQRLGKTDKEFQSILTQLQALRDKGAKAVQEAYARVPKDTDPDLVHEEALGYLVEHAKQLPIVQRFMSWLRRTVHKLTGNANWLKEHDFAKMADEVLKKQPKETQQRTVEKPLYSKAQQRTQFDVPVKEDKGSLSDRLQANVNKAKAATKNSVMEGVKNQLNNIRTATTHQAAIIASKDYQKLAGKLADEQGEAIASVLIDQAYDGDKIAAAAAHTGKPVITKKGISVVKDNNNVEQIFTLVHDFADKLGDKVEGKNIVNRYLLARRYNNIINSGKGYVSPEQQRLTKQFIGLNKQYPALTKIGEMVDATQHDLLDFMVAAGVLPKEKADLYKSEKGYVPLYRIMDDIESTNPGMKQYFGGLTDIGTEKAFKGSDKESLDVLDNIMTRYMWAVQAGSRNFAMQKIAKDYGVMGENGETKYYSSEPKANKEYFAPVMMNGKRRWVEYADPKIPGAVKPVASLGPLLSFFSGASRILRTGVTALPTFGAAQVVMDAQRAALYSGVNRPFELMGRVLKSYYDLVRPIIMNDKNHVDDTIERLHAHGISGGYGHTTQEITNRMRRKVGLDATTSINRFWDGIDDFAAASDMAQRKAIYEQTMKETNDELLALHRARNIINWRHRGDNTAIHMITQIVPFANAYAQSMDVQLSAMMGAGITGKNKKAAFAQFWLNSFMFMALSAVYAWAIAGDDEYEKMSEREKLSSFLIPGTGGVTIPVPSDIGLLYKALPEFAWRYITKDFVENPRDATKLRKAFREAFLDSVSGPNLMPQLVKGIVEIETNHNFMTGKPIVGHGLENLEPFKQYGESTSEIAKTIGEKMNWSPVKVDHLIKAYAGTLGSLTLLTTDQLINAMSDVKKPESHWYKNPMVSRFMADPRYKSQIDDYYDLLERSNIVTNTIANYRKHGDIEGAKAYREEHKEMTHVRQQVLNLQGQMTKIREQRNRIIDAKNISAEEKSQKIEALDERTGRMLKNIEKIRLKAGL